MTGIGRHLDPPEADILKRDFPDAVVALGPRAGWDTFVMNMPKAPFNDQRMRKATVLATDREKMIAIAAEGWGVLGGYIGPHTPYALCQDELKGDWNRMKQWPPLQGTTVYNDGWRVPCARSPGIHAPELQDLASSSLRSAGN
jgi:ABC-type transport system substrate-binding protein